MSETLRRAAVGAWSPLSAAKPIYYNTAERSIPASRTHASPQIWLVVGPGLAGKLTELQPRPPPLLNTPPPTILILHCNVNAAHSGEQESPLGSETQTASILRQT